MNAPTSDTASFTGFHDGLLLPVSDIRLPIGDLGITRGILLSEQLRTWGHRLPFLDRHLDRLRQGAELVGIACSINEIAEAIERVATTNLAHVDGSSDLRIRVLVTPGQDAGRGNAGPATLIVTATELPWSEMSARYRDGVALQVVHGVREVPPASVPRTFKHRNRIHYWLAERQTRSGTHPLLLDSDGFLAESPTATIALCLDGHTIVAPPKDRVLASISFDVTQNLFRENELGFERRNIAIDELTAAKEILWFSTPVGVHAVTRVDDNPVGTGIPGPTCHRIMAAWQVATGCHPSDQAHQMAAAQSGTHEPKNE